MKKRMIGVLSASVLLLGLLAGCTSEATPLTLTPTLEKAAVIVRAEHTASDGTVTEEGDRLYVDKSASESEIALTDHTGEPIRFRLESSDPDTMSMVVSFDKPLEHNGEVVTSAILNREEAAVLYTYGENGVKDVFTLEWHMDYSHPMASFTTLELGEDTVMCYGDGVLLSMYPNAFTDTNIFIMTTADDPECRTSGTYTVTEDTLILEEDAGLAVSVFRRDDRKNCWRFDAKASARHTLAYTPVMEDGLELAFGCAYEVDVQEIGVYSYRVTDFDGKTLLAEKDVEGTVQITPLSPTMLCIEICYNGDTTTRYINATTTRYINTKTGDCSPTYSGVIASSANHTAYRKDNSFFVETLDGEYTRYVHEDVVPESVESVKNAMINGDELTVSYTDIDGKQHIRAWNWRTGESLYRPLLIVEHSKRIHKYEWVLDASGTAFLDDITVRKQCELSDRGVLYYSGVSCAAFLLDGEYTDLAWSGREYLLLRFEDKYDDADALENRAMTSAGIEARLQADVEAGSATVQACLDGKATVYRYDESDPYSAVTVITDSDGVRSIYIGNVEAALDYASAAMSDV